MRQLEVEMAAYIPNGFALGYSSRYAAMIASLSLPYVSWIFCFISSIVIALAPGWSIPLTLSLRVVPVIRGTSAESAGAPGSKVLEGGAQLKKWSTQPKLYIISK